MRRDVLRRPYGPVVCSLFFLIALLLAGCDTSASQPAPSGDPGQAVYEFQGAVVGSDPWNVVALAKKNGNVLWRHSTGGTGTVRPVASGATIYATIYRDLPNAYHQGFLQALDAASGSLRWEHPVAGPVDTFPAVANGLVYLSVDGSQPGDSGTLEALRASDGTVVWHASVSVYVSSPAVVGSVVYLLAGSEVLAFDAHTGTPRWGYDSGSPLTSGNNVEGNPAPLVAGGRVYVEPVARGADGTAQMQLVALNAETGNPEWSYQTIGIESLPALDGNTIYVTATNQASPANSVVSAVDTRTGAARWTYTAPPNSIATGPLAVNGRVYLALSVNSSSVLALDGMDGHQIWRQSLKKVQFNIAAPAMLSSNGLIGTPDYGNACFAVLRMSDGGQQWCKPGPALDFDPNYAAVSGGVLYAFTYSSAHPAGEYAAVRFADGAVLWDTSAES